MDSDSVLATAQAYTAANLSVVPIRPDGSKAPACNWKELQERPAAGSALRRMFEGSKVGVGIVCGAVSGNLEVLDFEDGSPIGEFGELVKDQPEGATLLARLPLVKTAGGGWHLFYRCSAIEGNQKLAMVAGNGAEDPTVLIETRGHGGYVVAPGSPPSCHPSGKSYVLTRGDLTRIPTITVEQRAMLHGAARSFNEVPPPTHVVAPPPSVDGNRPGDDFNRDATWQGVLEPHGWKVFQRRGAVVHWCRPGKRFGTSATSNYEGSDLLYVFSSNAHSLEPDRAYSKFSAYTLLNHGGDFAAAAKDLAEKGFGQENKGTYRVNGVIGRSPETPQNQLVKTYGVKGVHFTTQKAFPGLHQAAFYGLAGRIVQAIEPHTEADSFALLSQLLVFFGNVIGRGPHWYAEATRHALRLFLVLVGDTSRGRKGTSESHIRRLFQVVDPGWSKDRIVSGLSSGEGLIRQVRDPAYKTKSDGESGDEELVDAGVDDKRLMVSEHEFASVLKVLQRQGNILSSTLRCAWDHGDLNTLVKNDPVKASGAHISVVGHITSQELRAQLSEVEAASGFGNRFLWCCVRRSKELPEGGNLEKLKEEVDPLIEPLRESVSFARSVGGPIRRDDCAREYWRDLYSVLTRPYPGFFGAMTARAEAQVMRLACLYALLEQSALVRDVHLGAAYAFWKYCEDSCRYIFGDSLGEPVADAIHSALKDAPEGITRNEIRNDLFQRNKKAEEIDRAIQILSKLGLIVCVPDRTTKGRPAERLFYFDHFSAAAK